MQFFPRTSINDIRILNFAQMFKSIFEKKKIQSARHEWFRKIET